MTQGLVSGGGSRGPESVNFRVLNETAAGVVLSRPGTPPAKITYRPALGMKKAALWAACGDVSRREAVTIP